MAPSSRSAPFFLLLLQALLLAARCSARDAPAEPMQLDPKCQQMTAMCTVDSCTDLCLNVLGLGADQGFCSFRVNEMHMYCCCPIPADTPPPLH